MTAFLWLSKRGRALFERNNEPDPAEEEAARHEEEQKADRCEVMLENVKRLFTAIRDRAIKPREMQGVFEDMFTGQFWDETLFPEFVDRIVGEKIAVKFGNGRMLILVHPVCCA